MLKPTKRKYLLRVFTLNDLNSSELIDEFLDYNFCDIWQEYNTNNIGFIGNNYQRLCIKFLSIIRDEINPELYYVYGKKKINSKISTFQGYIKLTNIREIPEIERIELYKEAVKYGDNEAMSRFSKKRYVLLAEYLLFEHANYLNSGYFTGVLKSFFYLEENEVEYYDLDIQRDQFSNNQCVGTWIEYDTETRTKCNWGEFRIPFSGDLDIGVGEFSINTKYLIYGWDSFKKQVNHNNNEIDSPDSCWNE